MTNKQAAIIVTDLGFGDAGKGSIVDFLARQLPVHTVVRFNGGSQAAHNVVTADGREHTFAQFGSASLVPGVATHLSRFMLVNPLNMLTEGQHLQDLGVVDPLGKTSIDETALIITPFQKSTNRLRELMRRNDRHGSCGEGIGETMSDFLRLGQAVLFAGDLTDETRLRRKLQFIRDLKFTEIKGLPLPKNSFAIQSDLRIFLDPKIIDRLVEIYKDFVSQVKIVDEGYLKRILAKPGVVVFEGAQGVLLDETFGFHPYTTWSTTTFHNALNLLEEQGYSEEVIRLGLLRAYGIRHGPGPFVTEDKDLAMKIPDLHNESNTWQRDVRLGYFDLVAANYGIEAAGGADYLAVTNLDRMSVIDNWKVAESYQYTGDHSDLFNYFEHEGNSVRRIRCLSNPDLTHQENLGQYLNDCTPEYRSHQKRQGTASYLQMIEEELKVPIGISSQGPTAESKSFLPILEKRVQTLKVSFNGA